MFVKDSLRFVPTRHLFGDKMAGFMRCFPLAGMIDETMSDAAGNVALIFVSKVVHCSVLISPSLQSFIQSGRSLC